MATTLRMTCPCGATLNYEGDSPGYSRDDFLKAHANHQRPVDVSQLVRIAEQSALTVETVAEAAKAIADAFGGSLHDVGRPRRGRAPGRRPAAADRGVGAVSTADFDGPVVVVHPEDVNLADVKAQAAELGATVVGNPYVPRGQVFVIQPKALQVTCPCGAAARAFMATRCQAESRVPVPTFLTKPGPPRFYHCGRELGHEPPHRWPADTGSIATWEDPP